LFSIVAIMISEEQGLSRQVQAPRASAFEWNGGWFGGQLGGSFWLLSGAGLFFTRSLLLASIWLGGFVILNALGTWFWTQRHRLSAYQSIQWFMVANSIVALLAWTALVLLDASLSRMFRVSPQGGFLLIVASFVGLMVVFYGKEAWARARRNKQESTSP
jgi:hypothetical protein